MLAFDEKRHINIMKEFKGYKIQGIIEHINKTQAMIELHESYDDDDPASAIMIKQYNGIKRKLFKELLAELMLADLNYKDMEPFVKRLVAYLKKSDEALAVPKELKSDLMEMERLMAA
ncbi:MAG TPA: hypothetical protein ENJ95_18650 [Bacteroidetes bacterium]|nr:hypothetical protein [Bacteroidota bacterium]